MIKFKPLTTEEWEEQRLRARRPRHLSPGGIAVFTLLALAALYLISLL